MVAAPLHADAASLFVPQLGGAARGNLPAVMLLVVPSVHIVTQIEGTMLAGVGPEMADALIRRFPTALALHRALEKCAREAEAQGRDSEAARIALISGVQVSLARSVGNAAAKSVLMLCA